MGLTKLTYLIPFTTKKFWNSGRWISSVEVDHTPLADAIMIGDIGMVKVWINLILDSQTLTITIFKESFEKKSTVD